MSYDMSEDWSNEVYSVNKMNSDGTLKETGVDDVKYINDGSFNYWYVISTYHKYANGVGGGKDGGGSRLTPEGKELLSKYESYRDQCAEANRRIYHQIFSTES